MTAFILIMLALAFYGAIIALVWWFASRCYGDAAESNADRAYRWREEMRQKTHDRQYR